jgi:hypothetical protein
MSCGSKSCAGIGKFVGRFVGRFVGNGNGNGVGVVVGMVSWRSHVPSNSIYSPINESPYCECGYDKETMEHYLLEYRNYKEPVKKLRETVGTGKMRVWILLGDPAEIKHTMVFIKATGRLSN